MSSFSWVYKPYTFWDLLPLQKRLHINFCVSAKNPHDNNKKNQAKVLKVYERNVDFHPPPLPRKCMVCTLVKMLTFMDDPLPDYNFTN